LLARRADWGGIGGAKFGIVSMPSHRFSTIARIGQSLIGADLGAMVYLAGTSSGVFEYRTLPGAIFDPN